jgi:hypothetical protein
MSLAATAATGATAPWWGSGVFVVGAAAVTALVTWFISQRSRSSARKEAEQAMRRDAVVAFMSNMTMLQAATSNDERNAAEPGLYTAYLTCVFMNPQLDEQVQHFYETGRAFAYADDPADDSLATNFMDAELELTGKVLANPGLYGLPKPS